MKTRYIFTDSSLETIYNSFVIENETILKTNISELDEIKMISLLVKILFFLMLKPSTHAHLMSMINQIKLSC